MASWLGGSRLRGLLVAGLVVALLAAAAALAIARQAATGPHRPARDALVRIPTVPAPISALSPAQIRTRG